MLERDCVHSPTQTPTHAFTRGFAHTMHALMITSNNVLCRFAPNSCTPSPMFCVYKTHVEGALDTSTSTLCLVIALRVCCLSVSVPGASSVIVGHPLDTVKVRSLQPFTSSFYYFLLSEIHVLASWSPRHKVEELNRLT